MFKMEEQYIKLETAKLAKQKGFDEQAKIIYYDPPKIHPFHGSIKQGPGYARKYNYYLNKPKDGSERIHASTQSLLQKWLREIHNICILVNFNDNNINDFYYFIHTDITKSYSNRICSLPDKFNTYEEALEIGLQEALKLI